MRAFLLKSLWFINLFFAAANATAAVHTYYTASITYNWSVGTIISFLVNSIVGALNLIAIIVYYDSKGNFRQQVTRCTEEDCQTN
jgi:hypothetical protein